MNDATPTPLPETNASPTPPTKRGRFSRKEYLKAFLLVAIIVGAGISMLTTALKYDYIPESVKQSLQAAITLDPQQRGLLKLMSRESELSEDMDAWLNQEAMVLGSGGDRESLKASHDEIGQRFDAIERDHEAFLAEYPDFTEAYVVYGDFLFGLWESEKALTYWQRATEVQPDFAIAWSRIGDYHIRTQNLPLAIENYEKALSLDATHGDINRRYSYFLMENSRAALAYFQCSDRELQLRVLDHLGRACAAIPDDFRLATSRAIFQQSVHPQEIDDCLAIWTFALDLAVNDEQREGVILHMATITIDGDRLDEAMAYIEQSTLPTFNFQRKHLLTRVQEARTKAAPAVSAVTTIDL